MLFCEQRTTSCETGCVASLNIRDVLQLNVDCVKTEDRGALEEEKTGW